MRFGLLAFGFAFAFALAVLVFVVLGADLVLVEERMWLRTGDDSSDVGIDVGIDIGVFGVSFSTCGASRCLFLALALALSLSLPLGKA